MVLLKLLKFSSLTRNSLKLYLNQRASIANRCWRLTQLNWESDRKGIAYQNGVQRKNDKEISSALKRFFRSARQSAFDRFICESKSYRQNSHLATRSQSLFIVQQGHTSIGFRAGPRRRLLKPPPRAPTRKMSQILENFDIFKKIQRYKKKKLVL